MLIILQVDPTLTTQAIAAMSDQQRAELLATNPDMGVHQFYYRWTHFFEQVILGAGHPLGTITDWFWRVEYQGRGSPHIHAILWTEDGLGIEQKLESEEGGSQVAKLIDKYISAMIPGVVATPTEPVPLDTDIHPAILHAPLSEIDEPISQLEKLGGIFTGW